jgi:hypothetical protein
MLKRLSNKSEVYVNDLLAPAADRYEAEVYRKVRIADVVDINDLRSRELGRLSLMGHFDFVVADSNHDPLFAIEFDGGGHNDKNDHLKDEICRRSGLALFRLTPDSGRAKIRKANFVAYLVDVWFHSQAFVKMQTAGKIPYDEPFMMAGFLKSNARNVFDSEFRYAFSAMARLTRVLDTGNPLEHLKASSLSMIGPDGQYAAFARHGDLCGQYSITFRAINWGLLDAFSTERELGEFCHALAYHDLCDEIEDVRTGHQPALSAADISEQVAELKSRGYRVLIGVNTSTI